MVRSAFRLACLTATVWALTGCACALAVTGLRLADDQYITGYSQTPPHAAVLIDPGNNTWQTSTDAVHPVPVLRDTYYTYRLYYYDESTQPWTRGGVVQDMDTWDDPGRYNDYLQHQWDFAGTPQAGSYGYTAGTSYTFTTVGLKRVGWSVRDMYTVSEVWGYAKYETANDEPALEGWGATGELWVAVVTNLNDQTDPSVSVTDEGATTSSTSLQATWTASDSESGVVSYQTAVEETPNDPSPTWSAETPTTSGGGTIQYTGESGHTYFFYVRVKNGVGRPTQAVSDGITVDTADPVVSITTPPGGELHLAPGVNSVKIKGIAYDAETSVTTVQVRCDPSGTAYGRGGRTCLGRSV